MPLPCLRPSFEGPMNWRTFSDTAASQCHIVSRCVTLCHICLYPNCHMLCLVRHLKKNSFLSDSLCDSAKSDSKAFGRQLCCRQKAKRAFFGVHILPLAFSASFFIFSILSFPILQISSLKQSRSLGSGEPLKLLLFLWRGGSGGPALRRRRPPKAPKRPPPEM
jgi:hypothetical protein